MADLRSLFIGFDLDTGAGVERVPGINLRLSANGGSVEAKGQKAMAESIPVVFANDQSAIPVDTEFVATALADNVANPTIPWAGAFLMGWNGTNWDRVSAVAGRLQVDVISGGGVSTPTNPANDYVTSSALAAGSSVDLDTADIGAKKLAAFEVWSTAAYKARLFKVLNGVEDSEPTVIGGGNPFDTFQWQAPHRDYCALTASGGSDHFRVEVTNLDDADPADVYATFHYED